MATVDLPGALILSLDFELAWGIRDHSSNDVKERIRGARAALPRMLQLFEEFEVAATWATVGFLFARNRQELLDMSPRIRPDYLDGSLYPYEEVTGWDEEEDPMHFASSLIELIRGIPKQEVASHTFSHFYCNEPGQDRKSFRADLEAARNIACTRGIVLESLVFPRNQHNSQYEDIMLDCGMIAFRGNPTSYPWNFSSGRESRRLSKRTLRFLDSYVSVTGPGTVSWSEILQANGLANVRASYPLRPYRRGWEALERVRSGRLRKSLEHAAAHHRVLHLWWHPHNFGFHIEENLTYLRDFLKVFDRLRRDRGMISVTMAEAAMLVREASDSTDKNVHQAKK